MDSAFGLVPDRKIRLFDRRKARWVGDYVHESVISEGRVGALEGNLLHYTCQSLSEHMRTMNGYTTLAAEELVARGSGLPTAICCWGRRGRFSRPTCCNAASGTAWRGWPSPTWRRSTRS
jgi:hypothetical protein